MVKILAAVTVVLFLCGVADAQTWSIKCEGSKPVITQIGGPVVPPVTPPVTPPIVPPIIPPPPVDSTPFVFPSQPPYNCTDPSSRYTSLGDDPTVRDFSTFYAALAEYCNPLPASHFYAGSLPDGRRLWVPVQSGTTNPAAIRRVLVGGRL